ncbi:MAG: DNA-directed DNA polymerase II small subunit [archaeon]|nr:DNA-directed DNA polymerase II small subunit [archaeon]
MSRADVLDVVTRKNMLLSPDALRIIMRNSDPVAFTHTVLSSLSGNPMLVTKEDVMKCLEGEKMVAQASKIIRHDKANCDIKMVKGTDITNNSACTGNIDDFFRYFQSRYAIIKKILENRSDFGKSWKIKEAISMDSEREVRIIGIVNDKKINANGNIVLTVEDDGDDKDNCCRVIIKKQSECYNDIYVSDEVLGFVGSFLPKQSDRDRSGGTFIAKRVVKPGVPENHQWISSDSDSQIAFLSDIHIGSYKFCEDSWNRMITWLKENSEKENINYIIMPGDVVDGIGVFPGQENELTVIDIHEQYRELAERLKEIPDHIKMVIHPGNHDACRPAEPQPALDELFTNAFDSNVHMFGNPVYLDIEGRRILTYHGRSIDDWVSSAQQLTYDDPLAIMKAMVDCRHLAPIYGQKTALAPEKKDFMAMEYVPDIFVSGHVHGYGYMIDRGIRMINASTWQDQTEYQRAHNFNPKPGVMPLVHLGTGKISSMNFYA